MNPKYPSPYKHAAFAQQYHPEFLLKLFALADKIRANPRDFKNALEGKVVALLFYREVLRMEIGRPANVVHAKRSKRLPVVLTKAETQQVIGQLTGHTN